VARPNYIHPPLAKWAFVTEGEKKAAAAQVKLHLTLGRPGRQLILTDTKQNYAELFGLGGELEGAFKAGEVVIREGRSPNLGPYY